MNRRTFALAVAASMLTARRASAQSGTPVAAEPPGTMFRVVLPAEVLPTGTVATGVVTASMSAGTTVRYPEGSAPESLAVDHVVAGGYTITSDSACLHIAADGSVTEHEPGAEIAVGAGETVAILDNSAAQELRAGDVDTERITVGIFTLSQGSDASEVDGDLLVAFAGGTPPGELPDGDVEMVLRGATEEAPAQGAMRVAFTYRNERLEVLVQPASGATPAA